MLEAQSDDSDKDLMELHNELLKQVIELADDVSNQPSDTCSGSSMGTCIGQASALSGWGAEAVLLGACKLSC